MVVLALILSQGLLKQVLGFLFVLSNSMAAVIVGLSKKKAGFVRSTLGRQSQENDALDCICRGTGRPVQQALAHSGHRLGETTIGSLRVPVVGLTFVFLESFQAIPVPFAQAIHCTNVSTLCVAFHLRNHLFMLAQTHLPRIGQLGINDASIDKVLDGVKKMATGVHIVAQEDLLGDRRHCTNAFSFHVLLDLLPLVDAPLLLRGEEREIIINGRGI